MAKVVPFEYRDLKNPKIIGVLEDYHFESAKNVVDPLVIYHAPAYPLQFVYFKLSNGSIFNQEKFEAIWAKHFDPFPFEFSFLEDVYIRAYRQEQRMMKLLATGCFVSIFLAAMGLLGIVGLQLNQRLKEISIRKILGATLNNLYRVLGKRFLLIISIGLGIGILISNFVINQWLENYHYHVGFSVGITITVTVDIALITIISQVFKVARYQSRAILERRVKVIQKKQPTLAAQYFRYVNTRTYWMAGSWVSSPWIYTEFVSKNTYEIKLLSAFKLNRIFASSI